MTLVQAVAGQRWEQLPGLYAEHTDVQHPLARGAPALLTRAAVAQHFAAARTAVGEKLSFTAENIRVHTTPDPEVIVAEVEYRGRNRQTGAAFTCACVFVMRVREGLIVESRDYVDHAALAAALER